MSSGMQAWRAPACLVALVGLIMALGAGCVMVNPLVKARVIVIRHRPFLIAESGTGHGWGYLSHPVMTRYPSGILLGYNLAGDATGGGVPAALRGKGPAFSPDLGKTWKVGSDAVPSDVKEFGLTCLGLISTEGGWVSFQSRTWKNGKMRVGWADEDGNLSSVAEVPVDYGTNLITFFDPHWRGIQMPSGTLLICGETRATGESQWKTVLVGSSDGGKSWHYRSVIACARHAPWGKEFPAGFEGPSEPAMELLPNGELVCVMRVGVKQKSRWDHATEAMRMLLARSGDGGLTWSRFCLPFEGVRPKIRLMTNGALVMAFGRPGNNLIFSTDGGRTWGAETVLTAADVRTSGYVDILEVRPGRLLAVYDQYNTDPSGFWLWEPKEVNGMFGMFVDVKKLW
ncbi:MAG: exo-alpha-sialidase [Phycisphaerae bacterium]|nr:exo-alpha-sialidase [Phycisphaerae bacterium]